MCRILGRDEFLGHGRADTLYRVCCGNQKKTEFEIWKSKIWFVMLSRKKFFGFTEQKARKKESLHISSREKTVVDGLMHPEYCGGMVGVAKAVWNARKKVNWQTVLEMAEKVGLNAVLKRLEYLLSIPLKKIFQKTMELVKTLITILIPLQAKTGWKIQGDAA